MSDIKQDMNQARLTALEVALAYTLTVISVNFPNIKPAVIDALLDDSKLNIRDNPSVASALEHLANLIKSFKAIDDPKK